MKTESNDSKKSLKLKLQLKLQLSYQTCHLTLMSIETEATSASTESPNIQLS